MKILILRFDGATIQDYSDAKLIAEQYGIILDFTFQNVPAADVPIVEYVPGGWGINFKFLENISAEQNYQFTQAIWDPKEVNHNVISFAEVLPKGARQFSQVNKIGEEDDPATEYTILHELCHSFYNFYGVADKVHAILAEENQLVYKAFPRILTEIAKYMNVSKLRFPLRYRVPIFGAGFNASRTDPRTGKKFRHSAQDYRARNENVYAPCDGQTSVHVDYLGGNMMKLVGAEYTFDFAHLSKYFVRFASVKQGDLLAVTGATGVATAGTTLAPHLHLQASNNLGVRIDPEILPWPKGEYEDMLIRNSKGEISYLSGKGVRHPISGLAYADLFDSADFVQVDDGWYAGLPVGPSFAGSRNLGSIGETEAETAVTE